LSRKLSTLFQEKHDAFNTRLLGYSATRLLGFIFIFVALLTIAFAGGTFAENLTLTTGVQTIDDSRTYERGRINAASAADDPILNVLSGGGVRFTRLDVGDYRKGQLSISGGAVQTSLDISIGSSYPANGKITITDGGTLTSNGSGIFMVGGGGTGTLTVSGASTVNTAGSASIGYSSTSTALIDGGSTWNIDKGLSFGDSTGGNGTLILDQNSVVSVSGGDRWNSPTQGKGSISIRRDSTLVINENSGVHLNGDVFIAEHTDGGGTLEMKKGSVLALRNSGDSGKTVAARDYRIQIANGGVLTGEGTIYGNVDAMQGASIIGNFLIREDVYVSGVDNIDRSFNAYGATFKTSSTWIQNDAYAQTGGLLEITLDSLSDYGLKAEQLSFSVGSNNMAEDIRVPIIRLNIGDDILMDGGWYSFLTFTDENFYAMDTSRNRLFASVSSFLDVSLDINRWSWELGWAADGMGLGVTVTELPNQTPDPATLLIFGCGIASAGIAAMRRRKK
jgi:hypothetical protein